MPTHGATVVHVRHASPVSAIQTAAGPARILEEGLVDRLRGAGADVEVVEIAGPGPDARGAVAELFGVAGAVARAVADAAETGRRAVVLAGSCHAGLGALSGLPGARRGVIWMDAHGDFHTPATTASGLLDATVLTTLTGRSWQRMAEGVPGFRPVDDERTVLLGVRALDEAEAALLDASKVAVISPGTLGTLAPPVLRALGEDTDAVYLHVDLDVLDASVGRANAWAGSGGLSRKALLGVVERAVAVCPVGAVGLASYDPAHDPGGAVARVAVEVAERVVAGEAG